MRLRETHARIVFVDTSAWFAAAFPRDANHKVASEILDGLLTAEIEVVTTNFVVAEFHGLAVKRSGHAAALAALETILAGETSIEAVTGEDEKAALRLLRIYDDRTYSLVDALSFVIMSRLGVVTAFAFDRHFVQHGFDVMGLEM